VLAGVGGRTIAEAKQNLSYVEALEWFKYIGKRGTLNHGLRVEIMIARLMVLLADVHKLKKVGGLKWEIWDFAPHLDQPEVEELTPETAMAKLQKIRSGG
jgi:hypothetical protein